MNLALVSDTRLTPRTAAFGDICIPDVLQERIGQKLVGAVILELTDGGPHSKSSPRTVSCATA